ncbi:xre family transcriptional regulator : DNA-binding helix-turn-helix protein OS=Oscillibacter sp. KLE 1745 GN=HMPREF1546_01793 PE=4 SV=1: HTH_3 [Gemmata massiliana]|uniref:HTH cro/C1-type domain-containing protein n=1 Tax=Gemmata massiliana TaxID=1210884 RepID=A0A6P2CTA3_9BACT|nr:helix-turn-helix transcriptional regulator [Gemmata massiliana]VTR92171.1 xre family transcriptional regulator : DNA-binding helix-turn-helix protein OS=Oscillibacter sp. KLE 1745 GN=HMPREF1546_01793 PE=4 SV=1: HTH_3 [Gemmata massiliana]
MTFGKNLKRLRAQRGWSQSAAARVAGIAYRSYQNWEGGSREPRLDALKKLADAFGVSADVLLADPQPVNEVEVAK